MSNRRPPYAMQRRAWECAYSLLHEFNDRLSGEQRDWCVAIEARNPETLSIAECGQATVLHIVVAGVRV